MVFGQRLTIKQERWKSVTFVTFFVNQENHRLGKLLTID